MYYCDQAKVDRKMEFPIFPTITQPHILAAALGTAIYIFHFHKGEHHLSADRNLQALFLGYLLLTGFLILIQRRFDPSLSASVFFTSTALYRSTALTGTFLVSLAASTLFYRIFLSPLNKFPGFRFSSLSVVPFSFRIGKAKVRHLLLHDAHRRYGKFVKIGPNDLSVSDADVVRVALGPSATCYKAPWYALEDPVYSLLTTRNANLHDAKRKVWAPAFTDRALKGYEERVKKFNQLFLKFIKEQDGMLSHCDGMNPPPPPQHQIRALLIEKRTEHRYFQGVQLLVF